MINNNRICTQFWILITMMFVFLIFSPRKLLLTRKLDLSSRLYQFSDNKFDQDVALNLYLFLDFSNS